MSETDVFVEDLPSMRSLIEALDIGETYSRARRFDGGSTSKDAPIEAIRSIRLSMQGVAYRVSQNTGNKYTIESGEFRTKSRDIVAVLCVTRIE